MHAANAPHVFNELLTLDAIAEGLSLKHEQLDFPTLLLSRGFYHLVLTDS